MKKFLMVLISIILISGIALGVTYLVKPGMVNSWFGIENAQSDVSEDTENPDEETPGTDTETPGTDTEEPGEETPDIEEPIEYITNISDYEFNGNSITGYKGSDEYIQLPTSYSISGTEIVEQSFAEEFEIIDYLMQNRTTIEYPLTITDSNNQEYSIYSEMDITKNPEIVYPIALEIEKNIYVEGSDYQITDINEYAFENCSNLKSIKIPEGITNIGAFAFYNCNNLVTVEIPNSVIVIDDNIFKLCDNLKEINIVSNNVNYKSVEGVLYDYNMTTLIKYPAIKDAETYIIPDSVTNIEKFAFENCSNLKSIKISTNLINLGSCAFNGCVNLETVDFNNCLSLEELPDLLFFGCKKLKDISIPSNITSIGTQAFADCGSLESIVIPEHVSEIGSMAFVRCNIKRIVFLSINPPTITSNTLSNTMETIYVPEESVEAYKSAKYFSNFADKIVADTELSI